MITRIVDPDRINAIGIDISGDHGLVPAHVRLSGWPVDKS
jgi:hypothetical protein